MKVVHRQYVPLAGTVPAPKLGSGFDTQLQGPPGDELSDSYHIITLWHFYFFSVLLPSVYTLTTRFANFAVC